jgi:acetyltransferase-like isoleucine patch superfamily enzyme
MLIKSSRLPVRDILLIGFLPSFIKKLVYKLKGFKIGKGVSIGLGSVIVGKDVVIGDNTKIGFLSFIKARKIKIGCRVSIGSTTFLDTPHLEIGDGTKISEQVFVAGMEFPDSRLSVGANCTIMQHTCINTAKPVVIGDDSGVGGDCILMTHGSWLSQFEGYSVGFEPIEIGKSVWLPWRVFVMPGAKIGDGSAIVANSLVHGEIPPKSLAGGSPARVLLKAPHFPKNVDEHEKVRILKSILSEMVSYFQFYDISCIVERDTYSFTYSTKRAFFRKSMQSKMIVFLEGEVNFRDSLKGEHCDTVLSLQNIDAETRKELASRKVMWIDIQKKERSHLSNAMGEEVERFIRRYGVRLTYV